MKIEKGEIKYCVRTDGTDDHGMNVGSYYEFDNEEIMIKFLNGEYSENIRIPMSYYEYPIDVYSKTEYNLVYNDDYNED